ncbi:MAG: chemotaxis response regulator protein-glutamate methylesterase [Thermodesulfovibrionales bacterium]
MLSKIRVLIVDDSAYSRQTIRGMFAADSDIEVVGIASNGIEAMAKTIKLKPDIITLDFEMPEMDGFSFLRWLMKERPTPVIMVSSHSDSKTVFRALELGAVDFIAKPTRRASIELYSIKNDLLEKVKGIRELRMDRLDISRCLITESPPALQAEAMGIRVEDTAGQQTSEFEVVAIGASTGGPAALQVILTRLPSNFPAGILISQHMPKGFTESFAERLNKLSRIRVKEADDGDVVERGKALICPGGYHLTLKRGDNGVRVALRNSTGKDKYTPSVNLMMTSVAEHFGPLSMGVVLTGMGNDGRQGIVEIKEKGGYTIAESDSTAVVFGMPNEAIKTGAIDMVLPLNEIPGEITRAVMARRD